ncbi:hypothetical protein HYU12_04465 [Candidatus Woesearchaeota archaeon]|nr:hypothetical protein [Candidatus Woesearchaeota archaeon]
MEQTKTVDFSRIIRGDTNLTLERACEKGAQRFFSGFKHSLTERQTLDRIVKMGLAPDDTHAKHVLTSITEKYWHMAPSVTQWLTGDFYEATLVTVPMTDGTTRYMSNSKLYARK